MRRWLSVLLMLLLPLQVSWSVAAEHGGHGAAHAEASVHAHDHAHDGMPAADEAESHAVCCDLHQCHTHGSFAALTASAGFTALADAAGYATEQVGRLRSFDATRIERPKWAASPITS